MGSAMSDANGRCNNVSSGQRGFISASIPKWRGLELIHLFTRSAVAELFFLGDVLHVYKTICTHHNQRVSFDSETVEVHFHKMNILPNKSRFYFLYCRVRACKPIIQASHSSSLLLNSSPTHPTKQQQLARLLAISYVGTETVCCHSSKKKKHS